MMLAGSGEWSVTAAASCVQPEAAPHPTFWYSNAGTSVCSDRMFNTFVGRFGSALKPQLVAVVGCDVQMFNIDGTMAQRGQRYTLSATWGGAGNDSHNTHRLRDVAMLDGFPYGMASLSTEGWSLFKITTNASGLVTGFQTVDQYVLPGKPAQEYWAYGSKIWRGLDGRAYIVGRFLDKSSRDFRICDMGNGSATPTLAVKSTLTDASLSSVFDVVTVGNVIYLLQWSAGGVKVFDVSDPSNPVFLVLADDPGLNFLGTSTYMKFVWGPAVVNKGTESSPKWRAYTIAASGRKLFIFDMNNPASPVKLAEQLIGEGGDASAIDSDGKLVAISQEVMTDNQGGVLSTPKARYYAVDNDQFQEIPSNVRWYAHDGDADDDAGDIAVAPGASQYKALRANLLYAYQDTIEASCLSTAPTASLAVARAAGMPGTPSCQAPTGAVKGFPGDGFVLTNQSSNGTTLEKLEVTFPDQTVEDLTTALASGTMTWVAPQTSASAGLYAFNLKVRDASQNLLTDTQTVFLCNDPVARLVTTHFKTPTGSWQTCNGCSWLQGYSLRFSTLTSDGHPQWTSTNPTWSLQLCPTGSACAEAPTADYLNRLDGTLELTLNSTGDYKVRANVAYPFLEVPVTTSETSVHSGAVTAAFTAVQGTTTIQPSGAVMVATPINLTFTGQVAPGSSATCTWALTPNHWAGASAPCANGATIPGNTLTSGTQYTLQLTATSSPATDQAQSSLTFTATDITGDFSWSPTAPNIGQQVKLTASGLPGGIQATRWTFPQTGCDATQDPQVKDLACGMMACDTMYFTFRSGGSKSVTLSISMDGTSFTPVATKQITVNNAGTCPTTCTAPSSPTNVSPQSGASVNAGIVTFSWNAASGTSPITYDVYWGSLKICSSQSSSCSSSSELTAGSYTWTVKATNSCGTKTSTATSFTVGSDCTAPGAPHNVLPANGTTVPPGNVTFTWSAATGTAPITYDVYLGALTKLGSTPNLTLTSGVTNGAWQWTVTAKNACGSATSTAYNLTVGTPCVAPGQPTNPTPANSGLVTPGNVTLAWTAPTAGTGPFTYDVFFGGVKACSAVTTAQCQVTNVQAGSHQWYVQAKNACGSGTSPTWSFSVCAATALPVAAFTWAPKDATTVGGVVQDQPYVGQAVTFDPSATTYFPTSFHWYDFNQAPWADFTVANPTYTWQTPGNKIVRMKATNCIGTSAETMVEVKVFPDIRPVVAGFTSVVADSNNPQVVTFTAATGDANGDPNSFAWDFGDGQTVSGTDKAQVVHTFKCGATFTVGLTSRRVKSGSDVRSQVFTQEIQVGGDSCSPQSLLVMDVARNLPGKNGALWNTDLTLYNPTEQEMMLKLAIKRPDATPREESRSFSLLSRETLSMEQILAVVGLDFQKASVWFYQAEPLNRGLRPLPVISARTHTGAAAPYDDYGQFVMVYPVYQATTKKVTLYLTGLRHNGKTAQDAGQGFRSNLTLVEPAGIGWAANAVKLTLFKVEDPGFSVQRQLWASGRYGYWQKSLESFFDTLAPEDDLGRIILKVEIEPGAAIAVGCSLVNNGSNAPIFVPAQEAP